MAGAATEELNTLTTELFALAEQAETLLERYAEVVAVGPVTSSAIVPRGTDTQTVARTDPRSDTRTDTPPTADQSRSFAVASARLRHAAVGVQVVAAGTVEQTRVDNFDGARTPRYWMARHTGLSRRDASVLFRSAQTRDRYPLIAGAFATGRLTTGHLNAIAGIIPTRFVGEELTVLISMVRDIESTLIEHAQHRTIDEFEQLCTEIRVRLDSDGPPQDTETPSKIRLHRLFDGRWSLTGDLTPTDGALLESMLQDRMATTTSHPPQSAPADTDAEHPAVRPDAERRANALMDLTCAGAGTTRPGRVSLFVHADLADLNLDTPTLEDLVRRNGTAHTEAGLDIDIESLWGLLADADITPAFTLEGIPLSYGRTHRLPPPILRRILAHRDKHCRFPGCDMPTNRCEIHHIKHWEHGGTTDPETLAHVCQRNHHDHHDRGWTISGDPTTNSRFGDLQANCSPQHPNTATASAPKTKLTAPPCSNDSSTDHTVPTQPKSHMIPWMSRQTR